MNRFSKGGQLFIFLTFPFWLPIVLMFFIMFGVVLIPLWVVNHYFKTKR